MFALLVIGFLSIPFIIAGILFTKREEYEDFLYLKLLGYTILGNLGFALAFLPIPVGYLLFHFVLRRSEKPNESQKHAAANWGLGLLIVGCFANFFA
ncbi:hypothetical protein SAMN05444162_1525 [Paenibacillaceae bacterium GAS479]|nr:hypothetical protein SAMN05444162_1525 [Paenibacillaceae bacterium GAS479]